jgi:hypothetical protein
MRGLTTGVAVRIGIVAVVLAAGFLFRQWTSGNAGELSVGDCFDPPTGSETVKDVQHHPCTDAHGGEVVFVGNMPDASALPDKPTRDQWVLDNCFPAYQTYTGVDINTQTDWEMDYYSPTADGWTHGDRGMTCFAAKPDGSQTKGSIKKAS